MNRITNKPNLRTVSTAVALGVLAALPLVRVPGLGDQFQAPRAVLAALALGVVVVANGVVIPRRWKLPTMLLGASAVLYAVSAFNGGFASAVFGVHGRFQGLVLAGLAVLAFAAGALSLGRSTKTLAWALAAVAAVEASVILVQRAMGVAPSGTTANAVLSGGWLAVAAAVVVASAYALRGWQRWTMLGAGVAAALGVGASGSRGAWLGLLAGALVVGVAGMRGRRWFAAALAGALVVGLLLGGPTVLAKLSPRDLAQGSAASRAQIWSGAARLVAGSPLLGVGPGRFIYEFPRVQSLDHARLEFPDVRADQAHSEPLHLAAEAGTPVALLVAALFAVALVAGTQATRRRDGIGLVALAGLVAYVTQSLFGIATVETAVLGWLLAGLAIARWEPAEAAVPSRTWVAPRLARVLVPVLCCALAAASSLYVLADSRLAGSRQAFARGDMASAEELAVSAVKTLPIVDVFRVAQADAALYAGGYRLDAAANAVAAGLELEPRSYDLLIARARLLQARGDSADAVAAAYLDAVAVYPLGIEVRREAIAALASAGRDDEAHRIEQELGSLVSQGTNP